ncbi:MAG: D-tyrosyl-tRNA(Tyr) deacylase [Planctomycetes bacterium]|nr:D-tyrosyl-tRNA(Tyr) deacylase [Planctomycetota bacterium]
MITLVQRVRWAKVTVGDEVTGSIERGVLLLVGVEPGDTEADADETARKVAAMRIFPARTPMDLTLREVEGGCLVVSQFTLAAELRHGNRPDFTGAAAPAIAEPLYERVAARLGASGLPTATGRFGAAMQVESCNDGPISLILNVRGGKVVPRPATGPAA